DLHQHFAVVGPFLDDAVAVSRQPDVVLAIGEAAVNGTGHGVRVAPGVDECSREIENQHRGRLLGGFGFLVCDVAPVRDDEMVMRVDADAARTSDYPAVRMR